MKNLLNLTIHELHELLITRKISSQELTSAYLERIREVEPKVGAYITVTEELAMQQAKNADGKLARKEAVTALTGIPLGIKDVLCTKGTKTTCASKILENFIPPYDATVVSRLADAGAVFLGKLNMDEFAMGSSTENSAFHVTKNPWNLSCVPGGSSGGSAASVAARECVASIGTDTGGSIRQPASHCGVVGLKPTYGRVSRFGLIAFASSLDQIGPMTRDVKDCAIMLKAIAGHDQRDSTSVNKEAPDYEAYLNQDLKGIRIGLPKEYFIEGLSADVEKCVKNTTEKLERLGCNTVEISLPHTEYAVATYYIVATSEAASNLSRFDGVKYGFRAEDFSNLLDMYKKTRSHGFGNEVKRRIMLGTYALSSGYYDAFYKKASQMRTLMKQDFSNAFEKCDVILTPVAPTAAFEFGEKASDPLQMYLSDIFTIATNLAGIPGISVPCGFDSRGLPVGAQLMAGHFEETKLLNVSYQLEKELQLSGRFAEI